jgi:hypothetical protein
VISMRYMSSTRVSSRIMYIHILLDVSTNNILLLMIKKTGVYI